MAWKYLQQLAAEANYLEVVREGTWLWVYDNFNLNLRVRHEREVRLAESLGVNSKKEPRLKADAVPTLFQRPASSKRPSMDAVAEPEQPKKKRRVAYEKRERQRVSTVWN